MDEFCPTCSGPTHILYYGFLHLIYVFRGEISLFYGFHDMFTLPVRVPACNICSHRDDFCSRGSTGRCATEQAVCYEGIAQAAGAEKRAEKTAVAGHVRSTLPAPLGHPARERHHRNHASHPRHTFCCAERCKINLGGSDHVQCRLAEHRWR